MAQGSATSADCPGTYDVVVNGFGYMVLQTLEPSIPFRTHRAIYSYTDTFVERSNTGPEYGDNSQDFFLTAHQHDWSLGEQQRFFVASNPDSERRYWSASNVDPITVPGQISIRKTTASLAFSETVEAVAEINTGIAGIYVAGTASLAFTAATGAITNKGAHGLGVIPSQWGLTTDSANAYLSSTNASSVGIRKYNGSSFTTFSTSGADSLAFLNNTLFGFREYAGDLVSYNTSGAMTSIFTWKDAAGAALTGSAYGTRLRAYGGRLDILRKQGVRGRGELWQYDGTSVSQLAELPANFVAQDMEETSGIIFISGFLSRNADMLPAIFYYANSTVGELWSSNVSGYTNATWPALAAYGSGLVFTDDTTGKIMLYNLGIGGIHAVGSYTVTNATPMMAASKDIVLHTRNATTAWYYPTTSTASSASVSSSLMDFGNSLSKLFRGIKVDWTAASDGNGGSVDIAYQVDSVDGSYTSLVNSAVSGTENVLSGVSGHSISAKITLNKGSSTNGPILKRIYVRAAPALQTFRNRTYVLDLSGIGFKDPVRNAAGMTIPLSGHEMAANLNTAILAGQINISDRFCNLATCQTGSTSTDSFVGICEAGQCEIYDVAEGWDDPKNPGAYVAKIVVREV